MKILIFSDLHGRVDNILPIFKNNIYDEYIFAGDFFGYFKGGKEVIELFIEYNVKFILGNHDLYFLREIDPIWFKSKFNNLDINLISSEDYDKRYGQLYHSIPEITSFDIDFIKKANLTTRFCIDNLDVLVCHGNPQNPFDGYIYPDYEHFDDLFNNNKFDVLILGHTHKSYIQKYDNRFILNPGSCTLPRGNDLPSYIVFDTKEKSAIIHIIDQKINFVRETKNKLKLT
ncbi:YfcE family phosphodiesterase [uncultured Flavobacterium sp.]|uniref:metallophosphoesterase family protein n=1 Tax=uncultured Flavobacterium sp. TaxID=165435 RepID=UPI0030EF9E41|tara:strand:- start:75363 stop:76052 length:690 start_codon:yes stop_codon:yes gene_type:complete